MTLKPFVGTRGFKSHPVELSQQPERVLRRGAVTNPAKRRQLVQKPCDSASKAPTSERSFWIRRGPCWRHRDGHGGVGLGGVREQGRCIAGFLRNVGSPGDNAPHDTDCVGGGDWPMVCAEALLKLAHWCRQRRQLASGGELCSTSRKTEFPPALAGRRDVCGTGATLDSPVTDHASERPSSTEPGDRSATTNAHDGAGGGA